MGTKNAQPGNLLKSLKEFSSFCGWKYMAIGNAIKNINVFSGEVSNQEIDKVIIEEMVFPGSDIMDTIEERIRDIFKTNDKKVAERLLALIKVNISFLQDELQEYVDSLD